MSTFCARLSGLLGIERFRPFLIGGCEPVTMTVVDYDPSWPQRFDDLAARVRSALGEKALSIEHIGSTSVPGLAAKAIIDMLIVVEDVSDEACFVTPLMEGGFVLRVREPDHRMMRTPERDAHLHFFEPHADAISACLDLREQLRRSPEDRELCDHGARIRA